MLRYGELREILERLEGESDVGEPPAEAAAFVRSARSPAGKPRSRVQFFALDTATKQLNEPLPIVVAVGVNYTQGETEIPRDKGPNCVEDAVKACRRKATQALAHFQQSPAQWRPANCADDRSWIAVPAQFHFVMTNVSPWITSEKWTDLGVKVRRSLWNDGLVRRTLHRLAEELARVNPIWIFHGKQPEVFGEWPMIAASIQARRWLRTLNLACRPSDFDKFAWLHQARAAAQ
jgi:hypothetical protein